MDYPVHEVNWQTYREQLIAVRFEVFVIGQDVPVDLEQDALDPHCRHFLATCESRPIGTARVDSHGHVGRVAVLEEFRGRGIGKAIMLAVIEAMRASHHEQALLNSQTSALGFYRKLGFDVDGDEFMEAGIPHVAMRLQLR